MLYREAVEFLSSLQFFGAQFGLDRAHRLAELAGNPQQRLRFIHVAGTNGKGSTCAMLEAIYRLSGRRVGLYTSPHLVSFRERIQINRELIPEADVARLVGEVQGWLKEFTKSDHPTFFEVVTVMALRFFAEQNCDLVILETGLGGRLDATNIVTPLASVITNVQFDHEKWLGDTIEKIAAEKAGIIKHGVPVVTAADAPGTLSIIRETAARMNAPLHIVSAPADDFALGLRGEHQRTNAALAIKIVDVLQDMLPVNERIVFDGLRSVQWFGRFQLHHRGAQTLVLDGAHNPAGALALAEALKTMFPNRLLTLILGLLADKNWETFCRTLAPVAARIILTPVNTARSAQPDLLVDACRAGNPRAQVSIAQSLDNALQLAATDSVVVIAGSLYLIGEAMELLGLAEAAQERTLNEWNAAARK